MDKEKPAPYAFLATVWNDDKKPWTKICSTFTEAVAFASRYGFQKTIKVEPLFDED